MALYVAMAMFSYVSKRHKHTLRNSDVNFILSRTNSEYDEDDDRGAALWNSIPGGIKRSRNLRSFRMGVNNAVLIFKFV